MIRNIRHMLDETSRPNALSEREKDILAEMIIVAMKQATMKLAPNTPEPDILVRPAAE